MVGGGMLGKIMVLTLSDTEDYVVEKILSLLSNERILIKSNISNHDELHFNKLTIYPSQRKVYLNGAEICLTTRELDLLIFLASHSGQVFTIRQIYANITDEPFVETYKSLESCLYRLRKKIGTDMILNVRGYGYKFNA